MTTSLLIPSSSSVSFLSKGTNRFRNHASLRKCHVKSFKVRAVKEKKDELKTSSQPSSSAEEITKKYGLEAGLWKVLISSLSTSALLTLIPSFWVFEFSNDFFFMFNYFFFSFDCINGFPKLSTLCKSKRSFQ